MRKIHRKKERSLPLQVQRRNKSKKIKSKSEKERKKKVFASPVQKQPEEVCDWEEGEPGQPPVEASFQN